MRIDFLVVMWCMVLMYKARRNIVTSEEQTRFYMSPLRQKRSQSDLLYSFAYCIFFKQSWKCGIHNFLCLSVSCLLPCIPLCYQTHHMKNMHNCLYLLLFFPRRMTWVIGLMIEIEREKCMPHDTRMNVDHYKKASKTVHRKKEKKTRRNDHS